jgi:hypothetical protein
MPRPTRSHTSFQSASAAYSGAAPKSLIPSAANPPAASRGLARWKLSQNRGDGRELCRVKVSGGYFARLQNRDDAARGLVQYGFPPLIVSHRFAVFLGIMWTRCGRESPPRGSGLRLQQ